MMNKEFEQWSKGCGAIRHKRETAQRMHMLLGSMENHGVSGDTPPQELLDAADKITNAAMWVAAHQAYAKNIYVDGRPLSQEDFKSSPQGHLGGTFNMIPAYVGYLLANALTGFTRGWVMEQGHAVAAIDGVNLLVGNMSKAHAARYDYSETGLTKFGRDFYSYALDKNGKQDSPLGSHVNPHTGGAIMEGGYLGFAGLEYVHMPLPGESLVAFLSDGAWEEQKGADWAARWWRAKDSGLVVPIMILNGRRIDQRSMIAQQGGAKWFAKYLKLHGFDPVIIDGRDPAAFAWAIIMSERRLRQNERLPYIIAVAPKGAGFYNEGTNAAHNLPLVQNPSYNKKAAEIFNKYMQKFWVAESEVKNAAALFQKHSSSKRPREKDNSIANRNVKLKNVPKAFFMKPKSSHSPMDAVDSMFRQSIVLNPNLRARVGNPDEILSNRMDDTLRYSDFRATNIEAGNEESQLGNVITALNEEAVAAAAFGNKGGINMIVTYEAFGEKMHGIARQEVIFSRHRKEAGKPAGWLSVPLVLTSNTWENGKNELSHQDSSMAECMFAESADISRVFFPADYNSAAVLMNKIYQTQGEVWTIIVAKQSVPVQLNKEKSELLFANGGIRISGYQQNKAKFCLVAMGTYQLAETLKAAKRLAQQKIPHMVVYIQEPGKFRTQRNSGEAEHVVSDKIINQLIPSQIKNILLATHTRPEVIVGALARLWRGRNLSALGFINEGGTLDVEGMVFVNRCSWAHILQQLALSLKMKPGRLLSGKELDALAGEISPDGIIHKIKGRK